jgi:hypothetical protein
MTYDTDIICALQKLNSHQILQILFVYKKLYTFYYMIDNACQNVILYYELYTMLIF